jgi:hypothetical protein
MKGMSGHSRESRRASRVGRPRVSVRHQTDARAAHYLPHLAEDGDVHLGRPPADLDLKAGMAFGHLLGGDAGDLFRLAHFGRVVGGDVLADRPAQKVRDADAARIAQEIVRRDVHCRLAWP